jgi:hypothetical protein
METRYAEKQTGKSKIYLPSSIPVEIVLTKQIERAAQKAALFFNH